MYFLRFPEADLDAIRGNDDGSSSSPSGIVNDGFAPTLIITEEARAATAKRQSK